MAKIIKRRNKYYARIRYTESEIRKEKQIPLKTSSLFMANSLLQYIDDKESLFKQNLIPIQDITLPDLSPFNQAASDYILYLQAKGDCEHTIKNWRFFLNFIQKSLDVEDLSLLTKLHYTPLLNAMKLKWPNYNTLNGHIHSFNTFINWCVEFDFIKKSPFRFRQFRIDKHKPMYFSNNEMNIIYFYLTGINNTRLLDIVKLYASTGMRLSEITTSYCKNGYINIYKSKGRSERSIPVTPYISHIFQKYKKLSHLDLKKISDEFSSVLKILKLYRTPSGQRHHFHSLRSTFAIRKYWETKDIYLVSKLLGHHSVSVTEEYAAFDIRQLDSDFSNDQSEIT